MSAINVNSITGRTGTHGPVLTGVTTAANGLHVGSGVSVSGISTFNNTVVGGATTELVVGGDARITGILTVGQGSVTISGDGISGITTAGITTAYVTSINDLNYPTAGALSNRNLIINGSMVIDQRSSGSVANTTGDVYLTCDRWNHSYGAANKFTSQQVTATPAGFYKSLQLTSSAATTAGSTDAYLLKQIIEGNNIGHLNFGGVNAKTITLSFYVKASVTGDYSVAITNGANNRSYVTTFNVASTDWEYKTITVSGDTAGSWSNDNTAGLAVKFDLGSGTSYDTSTTNAWQSGDFLRTSSSIKFIGTNAATFNVTGVQLELGTRATPFEHESYGQTLAKCQRYAFVARQDTASTGFMNGAMWTNTTFIGVVHYPVTMRAKPDVTIAAVGDLAIYSNGSSETIAAFQEQNAGLTSTEISISLTTGHTGGESAWARILSGGSGSRIVFNAEL